MSEDLVMYQTTESVSPVSYTHLDVYKRQRLAYPEAPEDFRIRFAVQTFIDGIRDCELQQVLRMARHRNSSEALVHEEAVQFYLLFHG